MSNYNLIDTHCHLDIVEKQGQGIEESILKAKNSGVKKIVQIGINYENSLIAKEIVSKFNDKIDLYYTIGCHPADDIDKDEVQKISQLISDSVNDSKFIGVGEVGLDYYHKKDNVMDQIQTFEYFIEKSIQLDFPLIIHSRDAAEDTYEILSRYKSRAKGVIHCFTYDLNYAKKFIDLGFSISFSGIIAFKNATDIHDACRYIPLKSILIETDAPFLSPPPHRGKRNDSSNLVFILEKIFTLREESQKKVEETIYENCLEFIKRK